jgi:transcriptional regulator with XRE-family HTH domain
MSSPKPKNVDILKLGEKVRVLRQREGLTVRQLGERLGVDHSHITKIERGENIPSLPLALKIADLFGVLLDQLARDEIGLND